LLLPVNLPALTFSAPARLPRKTSGLNGLASEHSIHSSLEHTPKQRLKPASVKDQFEVCLKPFRNLASRICPQDPPWAICVASNLMPRQIVSILYLPGLKLLRLVAAVFLPLIACFVIFYIRPRRFVQVQHARKIFGAYILARGSSLLAQWICS
jgi:hypothetical protein